MADEKTTPAAIVPAPIPTPAPIPAPPVNLLPPPPAIPIVPPPIGIPIAPPPLGTPIVPPPLGTPIVPPPIGTPIVPPPIIVPPAAGMPPPSVPSSSTDLTTAQKDYFRTQVGDLVDNPGWNPAAHVAGNTVAGLFYAPPLNPASDPSYIPPGQRPGYVPPGSTTSTPTAPPAPSTGTAVTAPLAALTMAQKAALFAQVGQAMYDPAFNYSAHVSAMQVNSGSATPTNYLPQDTAGLLKTPATGTPEYAALLAETGGAAAQAGFNYAAHVAAITSQSRKDLSYNDVIKLIATTGKTDFSDFDLKAYQEKTGSTIGMGNAFSTPAAATFAAEQLEKTTTLALPPVGSAAYRLLSQETGGASENPGFDYVAHVAATTSKNTLTSLSYAQVVKLIAETGRSSFVGFDLFSYTEEDVKTQNLITRLEKPVPSNALVKPAVGTPAYVALLKETGLSNLDNFDYAAHVAATQEVATVKKLLIGDTSDDTIVIDATNATKSIINGGAGNDQIIASANKDLLIGGAGNDLLDGGAGIDSALYSDARNRYDIRKDATGKWIVADQHGTEGTDTLSNVERISFADTALALDIDGAAGQAYRIYKAAFSRDPTQGDGAGLGYWIAQMDKGMDPTTLAAQFIGSAEFKEKYGANPTDEQLIINIYKNVLGREPDQAGYDYWVSELKNNPDRSRQNVLAGFSESPENKDGVIELIASGINYESYLG